MAEEVDENDFFGIHVATNAPFPRHMEAAMKLRSKTIGKNHYDAMGSQFLNTLVDSTPKQRYFGTKLNSSPQLISLESLSSLRWKESDDDNSGADYIHSLYFGDYGIEEDECKADITTPDTAGTYYTNLHYSVDSAHSEPRICENEVGGNRIDTSDAGYIDSTNSVERVSIRAGRQNGAALKNSRSPSSYNSGEFVETSESCADDLFANSGSNFVKSQYFSFRSNHLERPDKTPVEEAVSGSRRRTLDHPSCIIQNIDLQNNGSKPDCLISQIFLNSFTRSEMEIAAEPLRLNLKTK